MRIVITCISCSNKNRVKNDVYVEKYIVYEEVFIDFGLNYFDIVIVDCKICKNENDYYLQMVLLGVLLSKYVVDVVLYLDVYWLIILIIDILGMYGYFIE